MKALLCRSLTGIDDLRVEEVEAPKPGAGEVLIDVAAAGVNFPDVLLTQGKYQFKAPLPFPPGFELAGTVREMGEGVKDFNKGDRVLAAATMFTYATSWHALKDRAALKAGETLLVLGAAGGTGLAAVELGKILGARVIAAASSPEKLAVCREHGADEAIDYSKEDLREGVKRLTGASAVDVVYDPVGGAISEPAFRSLAWRGRHLVIGFTAGDIPKIPSNLPLLKGASLVGVFLGGFMEKEPDAARADMRELVEMLAAGRIRPHISNRYPLERGVEALREVAERRVRGKALIVPG